jgi:hypothetical protein
MTFGNKQNKTDLFQFNKRRKFEIVYKTLGIVTQKHLTKNIIQTICYLQNIRNQQ